MRKTVNTVKEARSITQKLDDLDMTYEVTIHGYFEVKTPKGQYNEAFHARDAKVKEIGYKYLTVEIHGQNEKVLTEDRESITIEVTDW